MADITQPAINTPNNKAPAKKDSSKLKSSTVNDAISKSRTMTGSRPDEININPIQEGAEKTAVMAYGRYNPPTTGHEKLIKKVESVAKEHNGSAHIIASHSEGTSKNPVPARAKLGYIRKVAGEGTHVSSSSKEHPTILHQAAKLGSQGHEHLVVVAGADRVDEYHKLLHKYNDVPSKHGHYNFKSIKVVSAGHRDPDAEGTEGMSGTKMREHARAGNMKEFKKGLPKALHQHADEIANHIKSVKEDIDLNELFLGIISEEQADELNELNLQQRMRRAVSMRRYEPKLQMARKRALMRRANTKVITNRARKLAISSMKTKLAGGRSPDSLSAQEKQRIEDIMSRRKAAVRRLTMRLIPKVRKREAARFQREDLDLNDMELLNALYEMAQEDLHELSPELVGKVNKIRTFDKPAKSPAADIARSKAVKKAWMKSDVGELKKEEVDKTKPSNREIGTDSLVNIYKKDTPGQSVDSKFNEAFKATDREAIMRSGQDRKKTDLVPRSGQDRKQTTDAYRQQEIQKKIIDEEQIDELSARTLQSYASAAVKKDPSMITSKHPLPSQQKRKRRVYLALDKIKPHLAINKPKVSASPVKEEVDRSAFLYMDPDPANDQHAQCGTCIHFMPGKQLCTLYSPDVPVIAEASCGLYIQGAPSDDQVILNATTPEKSGYVIGEVRCENCSWYKPESRKCGLFEELNQKMPDAFKLEEEVDPKGCCNAFEGGVIAVEEREAFLNSLVSEDLRQWFRDKWVRMDTKGNIKGDCAREPGEGKPKCLPMAKAHAMDKEDRAAAARRKRREDPVADRKGKGGAPINVRTEDVDYLEEKSKPTNPSLWSKAKSLAKSKFDVYPSAYANGWAAKWYKSKGGGWRSE